MAIASLISKKKSSGEFKISSNQILGKLGLGCGSSGNHDTYETMNGFEQFYHLSLDCFFYLISDDLICTNLAQSASGHYDTN